MFSMVTADLHAYAEIAQASAAVTPVGIYVESDPNQPQVYDDAKGIYVESDPNQPQVYDDAKMNAAEPHPQQPAVSGGAKSKRPARKPKQAKEKCARGDESGGRACNHPPVRGLLFCANHQCEHAGCQKSKSSGDAFCGEHLPVGVRPRAATRVGGGVALKAEHAAAEAPAEYDVLVPGYLYADLQGTQQQYGSSPIVVRESASYTGFNDAFGGGGNDSDDDLDV